MKQIFVFNGPNLNLLGKREPEIYGHTTLDEVRQMCESLSSELGASCDFRQTNNEGQMVEWLHEAFLKDGIVVINPAGFSFHSIPVLDALLIQKNPIVEIHISNIHARDELHRHSIVSTVAKGVICGFGVRGYEHAIRSAVEYAQA